MQMLNLNVERWSMVEAEHIDSELDFGNFDLAAVVDYISPNAVEIDNQPWNYNPFEFVKPQGGH